MCLPKKPKKNINETVATTTSGPRKFIDRLVEPRSIELINHLENPIRAIITPTPVKNLKYLNIMKLGGIGFDIDGNYQKQELVIMPQSIKKVLLDNGKFYVSAFILIKGKWKKLWLSRLFRASGSINFLDRHIQEAEYSSEYMTTEV
jgi:hypothetical protein